jgi:DNA-binding response OmpR family regulator
MSAKVLIIDADVTARMRAVVPLSAAGYTVLTADDAITAQRVAVKEHPQVVVLDLRLPAGDGYQVMKRLAELPATAGTPVIIVAADTGSTARTSALEAGAIEYLPKPVDVQQLLATLRYVLGPLAPDQGQSEGPDGGRHDPTTKTILVVDDDPDVRLGLTMMLKAQGYRVAAAGDTISAMRVAVVERPDLAILDIGLPGGEGFIVMERFRSLPALAAIPVVVLTGRDPEAVRPRAESLGAVAVLGKPASSPDLLQAIRAAFEPKT